MTYFSRIDLNPQRRAAKRLLTDPQAMHASVLALFPPSTPGTDRVLWRLDSDHPRHTLYVVSPIRPDFAHLEEQAGWETAPGQSIEYARFLSRLEQGSQWLFRLQATPTKSLFSATENRNGQRGKVIPLVRDDEQLRWLTDRASKYGFTISTTSPHDQPVQPEATTRAPQLRIVENREVKFTKFVAPDTPRRLVTLRKTVYEGALTVQDPERIKQTLVEGIGKAKAYGNGLLTLRR